MEENVHDVEIGETELDDVEATSVELEVSSELCDATACQGQSIDQSHNETQEDPPWSTKRSGLARWYSLSAQRSGWSC
jgi:hypothetical protein